MDKVVLNKHGGFYLVFGDASFVIHYFFGYKIKEGESVGFPLRRYDAIIDKLEELNINYSVPVNNIDKDFGKKNRFDEFVIKGKKKFDIGFRIDQILIKLEKLSEEDIDKVIDFVEGLVDKQ